MSVNKLFYIYVFTARSYKVDQAEKMLRQVTKQLYSSVQNVITISN